MPKHLGKLVATLAVMLGATAPAAGETPADPAGVWRGTLDLGAAQLRLELHVENTGEELTGHLVSVDQGGMEIPAAAISLQAPRLVADFPSIGARYEGRFAGADRLEGVFTQGGSHPLVLERGGAAFGPAFEPAAMIGTDTEMTVMSDGLRLAGSLRLPDGDGPFPAFIMLTGTGPQDRDETIAGRPVFAALASALAAQGIASLRLDDRGVGGSQGDFAAATSHDYAADALAALAALRARPGIDADRVGFLGHSEGAVTAFLAAADGDPDFILTLAGMTSGLEQVLFEQGEAIVRAAGGDDMAVAETRAVQEEIIELARTVPVDALPAAIEAAMRARGQAAAMVRANTQTWGRPWFPALLEIDTPALIDAYQGPVAALYAERDLQVLAETQSAVAAAALADNPRAQIAIVPGVNHLFQASRTGRLEEYQTAPHAVAPAALETIGETARRLVAEGADQ